MNPEWGVQPASFAACAVNVSIDDVRIVCDATLAASPGEVVGLLGPNGSGKSTLLRTVYRSLRPLSGSICVGEDDVWKMTAKRAAQRTSAVAQESVGDFEFTVRDVVELGRGPHKRLLEGDTRQDREIVEDALDRVRMTGFEDRLFVTLSGGEKQRALVARCLAQRSRLVVLDEPTNHLDVRAQFELLDLVRSLGVTALVALHDLNLAARYCDRVYVLDAGRVVSHGLTAEVLTAELLADVFGVVARCEQRSDSTGFHILLLAAVRAHAREAAST